MCAGRRPTAYFAPNKELASSAWFSSSEGTAGAWGQSLAEASFLSGLSHWSTGGWGQFQTPQKRHGLHVQQEGEGSARGTMSLGGGWWWGLSGRSLKKKLPWSVREGKRGGRNPVLLTGCWGGRVGLEAGWGVDLFPARGCGRPAGSTNRIRVSELCLGCCTLLAWEGCPALAREGETCRQTPFLKPQPPEGLNPLLLMHPQFLSSHPTLRGSLIPACPLLCPRSILSRITSNSHHPTPHPMGTLHS